MTQDFTLPTGHPSRAKSPKPPAEVSPTTVEPQPAVPPEEVEAVGSIESAEPVSLEITEEATLLEEKPTKSKK